MTILSSKLFAAAPVALVSAAALIAGPVTFHKDVEPVLQAHCQGCHRPGEIGPMSLLSYDQARPWAKAIRNAVLTRKMPPWSADPKVGRYRNDPSLSEGEIATLKTWADMGAAEGDSKDAPPPRKFVDGWNIGEPDAVFEMPIEYDVPTSGTIEYTYVILPLNFKEDQWVQATEARPGNRAVVHHVAAWVRTPGSKWLRDYPVGVPFVPSPRPGSEKRTSDGDRAIEGTINDERVVSYAPGRPAWVFQPGEALLIKAGSDLVLQLHYTANGKPAKDRTKIGMVFAKNPPLKRVMFLAATNQSFVIPPGESAYAVDTKAVLTADAELISLTPHMHLRGKAMEYRAVYPTGERETLLRVPQYDFYWQHLYEPETTKLLPKGTRLEVTGVFDNSANNPHNPDPKAEVRWGDQSWEEMMVGFFHLAFDPKIDPRDLLGH
jgi:hypothetical protein